MKLVLLSWLLGSSLVHAIICSQIEICNLITEMNPKAKVQFVSDLISLKQIPQLIVAGSVEMHKEIAPVIKYREDHGLPTLRLYLPSNLTKLYKNRGRTPVESLGNFWLYPDLTCDLAQQISSKLNHLRFENICEQAKNYQQQLITKFKKQKKIPKNQEFKAHAYRYHFKKFSAALDLPQQDLAQSIWISIEKVLKLLSTQ